MRPLVNRCLAAVAGLAVVVAAVAGCGIPENSDVVVVGAGPTSGTSFDDDGSPPVQEDRESTADPVQFVEYYLKAAAGDPDSAVARAKAFMSEEAAARFKGSKDDVRVVRLPVRPLYNPGDPEITLNVQQVGTLRSNGVLEPANPAPATTVYKIRVTPLNGRRGLFVTQAPPVLLLTDEALKAFYQRRTIYFWNTEQTGLVPDLRYMPRSVLTVQQPTTILNWLVGGPSSWLDDRVLKLQSGTAAPDNVPAISNDTLQVTLNAQAVPPGDERALDLLRRQLQWSLWPLLPRTLELKVGHQDPIRFSENDYLSSNAAYRPADIPERFVIFNGVVRRLVDAPRSTEPVPVLKPGDNRSIAAAAMATSGSHQFAAVVTGSGDNKKLRVGVAPAGQQTGVKEVPGIAGALGSPVWATTGDGDPAGAFGLITRNGKLYSFGAGEARPVEWPGDPGRVAAVSVAPDGRRVAVVAGGRLYRAVLSASGDAVTLGSTEPLSVPGLRTVAAVAWSTEDWLTVAGVRSDNRVSIMDMTIDGALQQPRLPDIGETTVSYLTAYPANPVSGREKSDSVSYTAAGRAWDALSTPVSIEVSDLAGNTANPPAGARPTAPFYLG